MPKSKREKIVSLTKTGKDANLKSKLVDSVRECVDMYSNLFAFSFENMRTVHFKDVRADWSDSRFFLGKNKVMRVALGRNEDDEYRDNLHKVGNVLSGSVGLLFTNKSVEEVSAYFAKLSREDYARMGAVASGTVQIQQGALNSMAHTMLEPLRKLGMPVKLERGVVMLLSDHVICTEGKVLTADQARLLKLFGITMAEFRISPLCVWSEGEFQSLVDGDAEKK